MLTTQPHAAQSDLWAKLEAFDLDGAVSFSFSKRLARDNGWPVPFARRVVVEYKKFLYLVATCGHPVTPSDEVDQAWHLHLIYTRSYWEELCGQVLGFPLHHGPTKGGAAEGHKFEDWYGRTLRAYQTAFGAPPPADIWPAAEIRFGEAPYFQRVNVRRHFLVPWPRWRVKLRRQAGAAFAVIAVLAGCTSRTPLNPFDWYGVEFLGLFWILCLTLLPLSVWLANRSDDDGTRVNPDALSTYEVARLGSRGLLVADSAFAALAHAGKVSFLSDQQITRTDAEPPTEPYERAVWDLLSPVGWSDKLSAIRRQALEPTFAALTALDDTLERHGLILSFSERQRRRLYPVLTTIGLLLFGLTKVLVGLSRGRPVGFLIFSIICLCLAGAYCYSRPPWIAGRGTRLLDNLTHKVRQARFNGSLTAQTVALTVALFGALELRALGLSSIATHLAPQPRTGNGDGGSGCSSGGDGGGGDGGGSGCGGCGGCGGGGD